MTYTDGSCLTTPEGNKCAAAIYEMGTRTATTIDPKGLGITNTINRAELAGIWGALARVIPTTTPAHILTDSLGSLLQIHKYLRAPGLFQWHPHKQVLAEIATCIAQRQEAGALTTLSKVKAHTGVEGNEQADQHANLARDTGNTHHTMEICNTPYDSLYWPHRYTTSHGRGHWTTQAHLQQATPLAPVQHLTTRKIGIYQSAWTATEQHLVPNCKSYIHHSDIPSSWRHTVMRYRTGCLYTQKTAYRLKHSTNALCPLCKEPDSAGHMLGACAHDSISGLRILRHNDAVRHIAKGIRQSSIPHIRNALLYMDAGNTPDAIIADEGNRVPGWLLPDTDPQLRNKLRPDILLITMPDSIDKHSIRLEYAKEQAGIYIIEVGYGADTKYEETLQKKTDQHTSLCSLLREQGWTVHTPTPFVLGFGGSIYQSSVTTLTSLGVQKSTALHILSRIQRDTAHRASQLVATRRFLEASQGTGPRGHFIHRKGKHRGT